MRVSMKWLEEFVAVDVPPERLKQLLDHSGTKVEAIHNPGKSIAGVVVAEVLEIDEHPNADNLTLVTVKTDGDRSQRVVCGARNFSVGDKVPLATVGARLPEMEITERKIRGETSAGMLCSPAELGISKDHSGILVLAADASLGAEIKTVLGLDDTIFELEITFNRPDCVGMIGVAREVAALLGNELKIPDATVGVAEDVQGGVSVEIEDAVGCPRYLARYIAGVAIAPSPAWMSARLVAAGIRPISNVVDVTNYVLVETGHPLHAFDAAKIHNRKIVVRRAKRGEKFTTLDGVERALHADDLLIADPRRAVAIAGVMGGADSEVSDDTTDVILESAYFDRRSIGYTSRRHLIRTEASARFEKGADPETVPYAAARAAQLMSELAGGRVSADLEDVYPEPVARRKITLRPARTTALLGLKVPTNEQAAHLRSIGLEVGESERGGLGRTAEQAGNLIVDVPTFRPDLLIEEDIVEEVARLAGFGRIPATLPPGKTGGLEPEQSAEQRVRRVLAGLGLSEAWTFSFCAEGDFDALELPGDHPARNAVRIENPMSEEHALMRTTMLPGLLKAAARNFSHRAPGVALFEAARVYEPTTREMPQEALVLGAVFGGVRHPQEWARPEMGWDFFGAKGIVESLLAAFGLQAPEFRTVEGMPFHPTRAARMILGDHELGVIGELHPRVCDRFGLPEGAVGFEIALAPVITSIGGRTKVEELHRFPAVYMDLAVIVDEPVRAADVGRVIRESGAPELGGMRLFDVYRGDQIPPGKKSLAFTFELRDATRTLTDQDAQRVRDRMVAALREQVRGELRG